MMKKSKRMNIPLFPLQTVLFPKMNLSLYIFEARYKLMVKECMRKKAPFGVVLLKGVKEGAPADPAAELYLIGTLANITKSTVDKKGETKIEVRGGQRFRILEIFQQKPYFKAEVGLQPEPTGDKDAVAKLYQQVSDGNKALLHLFTNVTGQVLQNPQVPNSPIGLSYWMGHVLPLELEDKQNLLELPTVQMRLEKEMKFLDQEKQRLEMIRFRQKVAFN